MTLRSLLRRRWYAVLFGALVFWAVLDPAHRADVVRDLIRFALP